jgi:ketosteroid isomerase-like protein
MSQDNVELVRRAFEAVNRPDADAWAAVVGSDFEFRSIFTGLEGRVYRGPQGAQPYFADLAEAWEHFQIELEDLRDLGDGRVLTRQRVRARGRASGAKTDVRVGSVAEVRAGKVIAIQTYGDPAQARRAAGV